MGRIFSPSDIEHFIERGHITLHDAFPAAVAAAGRAELWDVMGLDCATRSAWTQPFIHIRHGFCGEPFRGAITERVLSAIDELVGPGRATPLTHLGWWPVLFPGFDTAPWRAQDDWHVDGGHFIHRLRSSDQGLLPLFLFSDIAIGDGGTALAEGSHADVARLLADAGAQGLGMLQLTQAARALAKPAVAEAIGHAGDVVLLHPFLVHARSTNLGERVRFMCNPCVSLREPMDPLRSSGASPVETAIARALSVNA
jgi:hypothetical protein